MNVDDIIITNAIWSRLPPPLKSSLGQALGRKEAVIGRKASDIASSLRERGAHKLAESLYSSLGGKRGGNAASHGLPQRAMAEKYPAGLSESNEGLIEQPPMAKSKTKQFFLLLPWVISGLLAIYNAGPLVTSYLEWTPHLSVEFKPPPPDILNTSFCWKNEGKLFTLRNVHVKAQLFWFEYGDSFVIRPYKDEKVILESPFSPVEDIPPGQARCTRPLATFPENFWSKFTPDQ